jgi:hypothetical protein
MLRGHSYILYLLAPLLFLFVAGVIRGEDVPKEGVLWLPMIMWLNAAILVGWNGIRSWGYGISINDINEKLNR